MTEYLPADLDALMLGTAPAAALAGCYELSALAQGLAALGAVHAQRRADREFMHVTLMGVARLLGTPLV